MGMGWWGLRVGGYGSGGDPEAWVGMGWWGLRVGGYGSGGAQRHGWVWGGGG